MFSAVNWNMEYAHCNKLKHGVCSMKWIETWSMLTAINWNMASAFWAWEVSLSLPSPLYNGGTDFFTDTPQVKSDVVFMSVWLCRLIWNSIFQARVYTFIGNVEKPPIPIIAAVGRTTMTVNIRPAVITGGPVSAYFIIVRKVSNV